MNPIFKLTLISAAISLSACSVLETDKVDYRSASTVKVPSLEVPPDLTQLSKDTHYTVVGGAVSASGFKSGQIAATSPTVAAVSMGDVRIERSGNQRWLVVNRPAEKLWEPVKDFWQENGFLLAMDQNTLGIMETDWAENRAKIPQDFIRASLGKLLDSLYSTAERDRFRTRLERNAAGETEIFITHRGVIETVNSERKDSTIWQPRPADPELEAEFLRRLMVKLGVNETQSKTLVANAGAVKKTAAVATENGQPVVRIEEGFDSAWRRVGLALDRTGFTVEDRDRKQGVYFVRYVPLDPNTTEPGFFAKLFSSSPKNEAAKFQIAVRSQSDVTTVSVLDAKGAPETSTNAQRIVKVIADDIK
ncbi:MAG: outer membrane protein assembly factor BamC [Burkholderiales bacterium]|nr:outer membrane protein assembly factor BamC [Burkholderiales bacterium]